MYRNLRNRNSIQNPTTDLETESDMKNMMSYMILYLYHKTDMKIMMSHITSEISAPGSASPTSAPPFARRTSNWTPHFWAKVLVISSLEDAQNKYFFVGKKKTRETKLTTKSTSTSSTKRRSCHLFHGSTWCVLQSLRHFSRRVQRSRETN